MGNAKEIAALKRYIRGRLNMAAARGQINGDDALAILQSISAEFVSRISCTEERQSRVKDVQRFFPVFVEMERGAVEGMTRQ